MYQIAFPYQLNCGITTFCSPKFKSQKLLPSSLSSLAIAAFSLYPSSSLFRTTTYFFISHRLSRQEATSLIIIEQITLPYLNSNPQPLLHHSPLQTHTSTAYHPYFPSFPRPRTRTSPFPLLPSRTPPPQYHNHTPTRRTTTPPFKHPPPSIPLPPKQSPNKAHPHPPKTVKRKHPQPTPTHPPSSTYQKHNTTHHPPTHPPTKATSTASHKKPPPLLTKPPPSLNTTVGFSFFLSYCMYICRPKLCYF